MNKYRVSFVHHEGTSTIEAKDITQAKRIASRKWNKMNIRSVWLVAQAALNSTKAEAIANADAHANNAGLPTYSELVEALKLARAALLNAGPSDVKNWPAQEKAESVVSKTLFRVE